MDKLPKKYIFIDESGDASFYAKKKKLLVGTDGFQPLLSLGMIMIEDKQTIHQELVDFADSIKEDVLFNSLHCVNDPKGWYLHARADHTDIKLKMVEFLRKLDGFKTFIVLGRKRLSTFQNKHNNNESEFYFDLVYHLLKDRMNDEGYFYQIILAGRTGSSSIKLKEAIEKAIERDNSFRKNQIKIQFECKTAPSSLTPELSIVDYMLWALQRYIFSGEARYFKALQNKFSLIIDLYDLKNFGKNYYHRTKNPFTTEKASEFRKDGYV
ncbi:MAG: DUF3800 domain-containing protein [Arcicella sp.]|jgi:Protein of unknown function (DUF3800)|nr:DUF3800 domain-containing protein [Arcicella sp.]